MSQEGILTTSSSGGGTLQTLTGDVGGAVSPDAFHNINILANPHGGQTVLFSGTTPSLFLIVSDANHNTLVGEAAGNVTLASSGNTSLGYKSLGSISAGVNNVAIGSTALQTLSTANGCTAVGQAALLACNGTNNIGIGISSGQSITSGIQNVCVGSSTLGTVNTGSYNIALGHLAGSSYATGSENSNIVIGNTGTNNDSHVIRLGTTGSGNSQQNTCYIAGITGVTATSSEAVFINSSTGQLGVIPQSTDGQVIIGSSSGSPLAATLTAGTGVTITNGANSITIASTNGSIVAWTDKNASFNAAVGNGYFVTATATATLPASPIQGDTIAFTVDTADRSGPILTITGNTGQKISIGDAVSAAAGTAASHFVGDSVTLVYRASDTTWTSTSVIGTWTLT